jgi:hypothetical protein
MPTSLVSPRIPLVIVAALIANCARPSSFPSQPPGSAAPLGHEAADTVTRPWADSSARGPGAEIYRTWLRYLGSMAGQYRMGAWQPSPYWLAAEQQRWHVYNLAMAYLPDSATPEVLTVQRASAPDQGEYRVVTRFREDSAGSPMQSSTVRMTVFALRSGDGWVFANALPRFTRTWRRETLGTITYVIEPGYAFDRGRAVRAVAFTDSPPMRSACLPFRR